MPIFLILGQTASGKTSRAVQLARQHNGELVNCDSRQIYRYLDIITGKTDNPTDIPVHMVDIVDPSARYTAHDYAHAAYPLIRDILRRGKTPIVVGGTGLYAHYLLHSRGVSQYAPTRQSHISSVFESQSKEELQTALSQRFPAEFSQLNPSDRENPHRLMRHLQRLTAHQSLPLDLATDYLARLAPTTIEIYLHGSRESHRTLITRRVHERLDQGAVGECQRLLALGYTRDQPGLRTLGYTELFEHLAGATSLGEATNLWITREAQYAKRQKTYCLKYFPSGEIITLR